MKPDRYRAPALGLAQGGHVSFRGNREPIAAALQIRTLGHEIQTTGQQAHLVIVRLKSGCEKHAGCLERLTCHALDDDRNFLR